MNKRECVSISKKLIFIIISFSFQFSSYPNDPLKTLMMKANFFKKGETKLIKSNIAFKFEKWLIKKQGNKSLFVSYFKNKDGQVVAKEQLFFKGKKIIRYELDQFQVGEYANFFLKEDGYLEMLYKKGERNQLNKLKWGRNFILPPMIIDYIRDNYSLFLKKPQEVELVVPHLQKNISFTFSIKSKNDPKCFNEAYLCILFRPSNFFIRLFADSLHLSFDKKLRLIKASGPTLLYWKENKHSLVPFSGDSYFNY